VVVAVAQTWNTFHVGTYRLNSQGLGIAESLTGSDLNYSWYGGTLMDGYGWPTDGGSYQMLDMEIYEDEFYGVGSTIIQPPMLFLPPVGGQVPNAAPAWDPREMATGIGAWEGELWSLDIDAGGLILGGVDQDRDVGHVFVSTGDFRTDPWLDLDVSVIYPGEATWIRGVCRNGSNLVAVGEFSIFDEGIVLHSTDGGQTWTERMTMKPRPGAMSQCWVNDDGSFAVTGSAGWYGVYTP
jgi:hypothetical protein